VKLMNLYYLPLPEAKKTSNLWEVLAVRRSVRSFSREPLTLDELSLILWASQGISDPRRGFRVVPSAGATFPLNIYVVVGEEAIVGGDLPAGIYEYLVTNHALKLVKSGDFREALSSACLNQTFIAEAPISLVIAAVYERTTGYYGRRGIQYVHFEVGHAGQNIYLAATALGLGTVAVGAFKDDQVKTTLNLTPEEVPLYVFPIGRPKRSLQNYFNDVLKYYLKTRGD